MVSAVRAELTKILTLPRVWIATGVVLGLHALVLIQSVRLNAEAVAGITPDGVIEIFTGTPQPATEAILGLLAASSLQMGLLVPVLAAVIAGQEFRSNQLGVTVLAMPRRGRLIAAKAVATAAHLLLVAVLIAGISTAFMYAAVEDWNPGLLVTGAAFLGHGRFVAFAVLSGLTGFGITVIARSTLVGVIVTIAQIAVTMTQALAGAAPALDALLPVSAARNLLLDPGINRLTAGPGHALLVLIAWAGVTTAVAGITLGRRDAR